LRIKKKSPGIPAFLSPGRRRGARKFPCSRKLESIRADSKKIQVWGLHYRNLVRLGSTRWPDCQPDAAEICWNSEHASPTDRQINTFMNSQANCSWTEQQTANRFPSKMLASPTISLSVFTASARSVLVGIGGQKATGTASANETCLSCTFYTHYGKIESVRDTRTLNGLQPDAVKDSTVPRNFCPQSSDTGAVTGLRRTPEVMVTEGHNPIRETTMQIRATSNIQTSTPIQFESRVASADSNTAPARFDTTDQIEFSREAQVLAGLNDAALIRTDRVNSIRQQIATGQYETAEKLDVAVQRLLDELA
jgi:negative regulator of flagellin synthesis FlgM